MRRIIAPLLAAVVLIAAVVTLAGYLGRGDADLALVVSEVDGTVTIANGEAEAETARTGTRLEALDRVATGEGSRATLALGQDTRIRLGPQATVQLKSVDEEGGVQIELEEGALQATVRPSSGALRVSSDGREALLTDADVAMGVGTDDALQIEVSRGDVMIGGIVGTSLLSEGSRLKVAGREHAEIGPIPDDILLSVEWPERRRTRDAKVPVTGVTEPNARVKVTVGDDIVEVTADATGRFRAEVPLAEGDNDIQFEATDLLGNAVAVRGVLERDSQGPTFRGGVEYRR